MTENAYRSLCERYGRYVPLQDARMVLEWDQHTKMPDGGTTARNAQIEAQEAILHDYLTAPEMGDLLDCCAGVDLAPDQQAVVRDIRRQHGRAAAVPSDLADAISSARSEAWDTWLNAYHQDDFDAFAPKLDRLWRLQMEKAEHIDPTTSPYEVMFQERLPYVDLDAVDRIFQTLREELPPLIEEIRGRDKEFPAVSFDALDGETQATVAREWVDELGFDFEHGRFDANTMGGGMTVGNQFDTRFIVETAEDGFHLPGTLHEYGHATYDQGLPKDHYGSPLGQPLQGLHESQAHFWNIYVGNTRAFWDRFLPSVQDAFPSFEGVTPQEAFELINRVEPQLQRSRSDRLTYQLHILIRCEIDRAVVEGDLDVEEIPAVWADTYEEYLGIRPESDSEGCLQDPHWTAQFARFHEYTIGYVVAAQLDAAMRDDLDDVDGLIRTGEFEPIHEWLTENIYRHGRRYPSDELIERATGEPLTADYFIEHAEQMYGNIYDL